MNRCCSKSCCRSTCRCYHNQNNDSYLYSNICLNKNNVFPENYLYGHAYTPVQTLNNTYIPGAGLQNGTIFPELVSPYYPGQSIDFIEFLKNGGNENG